MQSITLVHVTDKGTTSKEVDAAELLANRRGESELPAYLRNAAQFKHYEVVIPGVTGIGSKFTHEGEPMTVVDMTPNWLWATFDKWDKEPQP